MSTKLAEVGRGDKTSLLQLSLREAPHSLSSYCCNASKIDTGQRNGSKCNKCAICPGNNTGRGRQRPVGECLPPLLAGECRVNAFSASSGPTADLKLLFFKAFSNARKRQWSNYLIISDWTNCLFPLFSDSCPLSPVLSHFQD